MPLTKVQSQMLGAGTVLQVVTVYDATGGSTSSGSAVQLSSIAASITPQSTSSKLVISATFQGIISAGGAGYNSYGQYRLNEGATILTSDVGLGVVSGSGTNMQTQAPLAISWALPNTALTTRNFYVYGYKIGGSSTVYASSIMWTITEIAG